MEDMWKKRTERISWRDFRIMEGFWKKRQERNRQVTLPTIYEFFQDTGRMDSMKGLYKPDPTGKDILRDRANGKEEGVFLPGGEIISFQLSELNGEELEMDPNLVPRPHPYWDSDVAKWIEGASYALLHEPNPEVEKQIDKIVEAYEKLQGEDGYVNTYFTFVEPGKRFTNIHEKHELYCAGHMTEAAVAYYESTGKDRYLKLMCRYIDYIDRVIGPEEGKLHAYPGHQELELALVKLYEVTKEPRYLRLAEYFINERGKQPYYFDIECAREGRNPNQPTGKGFGLRDGMPQGPFAHFQAHLPVREQKDAAGHAVRLMYQCCAMADVAARTGDESLKKACRDLWDNVTLEKMYITGGVGAEAHGERFSFSYQLPNEQAYNETCAAIGLAMWAARMLQLENHRKYGDVLERALYNGIISGVSQDGKNFFYANHLECMPAVYEDRVERQTRMFPVRQGDFPVSCCPPNLARFTESITGYAMTQREDTLFLHLYLDMEGKISVRGQQVGLRVQTLYPDEGNVFLRVTPEEKEVRFTLALRIPQWCQGVKITICGEKISTQVAEDGYVYLDRSWKQGEELGLFLEMRPFLLEANPRVRMDCGKVSIQCGPFIYCLEEADNGTELFDICLDADTRLERLYDPELLGGTSCIVAKAKRRVREDWQGCLYRQAGSRYQDCDIRAIPYYLWSNRRIGEMVVWIRYR
ncbi:MAG: glycoside hydrolase family 127 protein [Lachnospiraceae bacterium]|nr:glycoside hydrolase family 127 protein [Lachnospiraceae bacterium]